MVELGGGRYIGTCDNVVMFVDPRDGKTLQLFTIALRSPEDVALALKNHREPIQDFEWQEVTQNERG